MSGDTRGSLGAGGLEGAVGSGSEGGGCLGYNEMVCGVFKGLCVLILAGLCVLILAPGCIVCASCAVDLSESLPLASTTPFSLESPALIS